MAGLGEKKIRHTHSTKPVEPEPDADDGALPDEAVDQRRKLHKNEPPKT